MIIRIPSLKNVHKFVFSSWQASPSFLKLNQFRTALCSSTFISSVFVNCWPKPVNNSGDIFFYSFFYLIFSSGNNTHKATLCNLLHQVMVLLCLLIPTACMLYIPLTMLLAVKSLIFYFPSVPSGFHIFLCITFCNIVILLIHANFVIFSSHLPELSFSGNA